MPPLAPATHPETDCSCPGKAAAGGQFDMAAVAVYCCRVRRQSVGEL